MKKVFIGVLAALMLFAFTACEQQPIDMNGYIPATVSISQNSVIVAGQAITPDMFTTTVTYANGETGSANGQISFDMETIGQQPDQQSYIVAKVAVVGESKTISATTPVVITPVTALAISGEEQTVQAGKDFDYDALTIVATYEGGTYTYKSTDYVSVSKSDSSNIPSAKTTTAYAVKASDLDVAGVTVDASNITVAWNVNVTDAAPVYGDYTLSSVTQITAEVTNDDEIYFGDSYSSLKLNVYAGNSSSAPLMNPDDYVVTPNLGSTTFGKDAVTFEVYIKGTAVSDTVTVTPKATLTASSITISQKTSKTVLEGGSAVTIDGTYFDIEGVSTFTEAKVDTTSNSDDFSDIKVLAPNYLVPGKEGDKHNYTVTFKYLGKEYTGTGTITIGPKANA